jgi:hypothetical protein
MCIDSWWESRWNETTGKTRCRWVNNIKMDLGDIGWGDVHWIGLAKDRDLWRAFAHAVMNFQAP